MNTIGRKPEAYGRGVRIRDVQQDSNAPDSVAVRDRADADKLKAEAMKKEW